MSAQTFETSSIMSQATIACLENGQLNLEKETSSTEEPRQQSVKGLEKVILISLLCSAQFFDIFNSVSTMSALPEIGQTLNFTSGALQWVITAYTLTFAAFLLSAGRLSDVYHPKPVFCLGYVTLGLFSVLCGVSVHPIMMLVFRAIQGIGAAMTLPSAIAMIVLAFPEPKEQGRVLAIFAGFGAVGNVVGFILGGVLTARIGWRWIFYLSAIIITPFSILSFFLLPKHNMNESQNRKIDWQGVVALGGGLILFVYAISDGNVSGWKTPQVIVTLIFSVVFIIAFFIIERCVKDPAVPPRTWTNKNFLPLFLYSWSIYWHLNAIELQLIQIFQDLFHWSALSAAVHCLPIGLTGLFSSNLTGFIAPYVPRRVLLIGGQVLMVVSTTLFALADTPDKYWSHILPGMIIGITGTAMAYVAATIFIMAGARKGEEGVVGAMMNTAFQLGATVGIAIVTAVTIGVNQHQPSDVLSQHKGYEASFWSVLGMHGFMIIMATIFVE